MGDNLPLDRINTGMAPANPLVEATLSLVQDLVRNRYRESGLSWAEFRYAGSDRLLRKEDLAAIERRLAVKLPPDYRTFLMHAGHGGAGPYYGLFCLEGGEEENITSLEQLRKPVRRACLKCCDGSVRQHTWIGRDCCCYNTA